MPINLTTPFVIPNGTRLVIDKVKLDEEAAEMTVVLDLRTAPGTDNQVSEVVLVIRNGPRTSDRVSRGTAGPLQEFSSLLTFALGNIVVTNGYDNAVAAWKAGANAQARRNALETHLLAAGYIHSSLTGT